jgi:hypothetical protein
MSISRTIGVVLLTAFLVACARDKGPAEEAIKQAAQAVEQVRSEAARFVPEQFSALEGALKAAQDSFAKQDYKGALAAASGLAAKAQEVAKAAADKKAELTKSWEDMSAGIPAMMDAIKSRLDILGQAKKLPAGLDKDKLAAITSSFDEAAKQFEEAKAAAGAGDLAKAVAAGSAIKESGMQIATTLGLRQQQ